MSDVREPTDLSPDLDRLELPSMRLWSVLRYFGPGTILMMTGIGTESPGHGSHRRRPVRLRAPLVHSSCVHLQVLRFRDGVSIHPGHRQEPR